jgi:N-acetylmuramoyl-L-alanine amidase
MGTIRETEAQEHANNLYYRDWYVLPIGTVVLGMALLGPARLSPVLSATGVLADQSVEFTHCDPTKFRTIVDVGHTSEAGGALSARGQFEYEFNQRLAKEIVNKLLEDGFDKTILLITRGRGRATLLQRSRRANSLNADLVVSVHHDSVQDTYLERWNFDGKERLFSDKYRGYSIFVSRRNPNWAASLSFATKLADELQARGMTFTTHHAENIKGERRQLIDPKKGIYRYDELVVLKNTKAPAVLFEAGVIVNREEEALLSSADHHLRIGDAVAAAIKSFCRAST